MIYRITGVAILALGILSAAALFMRAVIGKDKKDSEGATGTLWGLFLVGIIGGIVLLRTLGR